MTGSELPVDFTSSLGADSADVDNDGDYDVMVANDIFQADHLLVNDSNIPDSSAPRVVLEQVAPADASSPVAIRAAVYDNASWDVQRYNATVLEYSVNGGPLESVPMLFAGGQSWRAEIPAGTTGNVTYTAVSSDHMGNTGVSATLAYSIEGVESYCTAGTSASGCQALLSASGTPSASAPSRLHGHGRRPSRARRTACSSSAPTGSKPTPGATARATSASSRRSCARRP